MRALIKRRTTRLLAVSAMTLAMAGAAVGGAQAASTRAAVRPVPMLPPGCTPYITVTGTSAYVAAYDEWVCYSNHPYIINWPVRLSRLVNGVWVVVASGDGVAVYNCVGTTSYEYQGVPGYSTRTFACG